MLRKLFFAMSIIILSEFAFAADVRMVFWYPGEAGTTEEGQPVLNEFFSYVNTKLKGSKLTGKYFNTVEEGLAFISRQKPAIGIISYAVWEENKSRFPNAQVWLATNPAPHGQRQENYILVGRPPSPSPTKVFSSEPLSSDFVKNQLGFDVEAKPEATSQILMKLKAIADGTLSAVAILTPMEDATLSKMTAPWARSLTTIAKSAPVPTARVVLFNASSKDASRIKKILLEMKNDPSAKEVLEELRLTGFSEP